MIESFDPLALPLYAVAIYAAAMYPLGLMLGSECSLCCCPKCTGCDCCGEEYARPVGFCCEGEWRMPGTGSCCGGEWRTTEEGAGGQCCDDVWYTTGTCCKVPTVPLLFTSDFGGVGTCDALARGKMILTDGETTVAAVLQHGGAGYARVVDDVVEVATVTVISLNSSSGTSATMSATIDDDPESETFGTITALTVDSPGSGYGHWVTQLRDHLFTGEGTCCGNDWRTGEGDCCKGVWYPEAEPCPEGQVYIRLSEYCCGCWPDEIYDPEAEELVPTADNTDLLSCSSCNFQSQLYSRYDNAGVDKGDLGRCCADGGACTYTFESDCEGTWEEKCCDDLPKCTGPCCKEDDAGVVGCEIIPNDECTSPGLLSGEPDCESSCKGACCVDGELIGIMSQSDCDAEGGCWAGIGQYSCRPPGDCRPPFTTNCCESTVSGASGLTFTQPLRKRCDSSNTAWLVTVTGTTDSEILIHGTPVGQTATPTKRCPINVSFVICWDKFNIEPMPCDTSFRRLDVTVCWEPVENASEIVNYSGCNDISLWLSDCTRGNCKTTLVYSGTGVTSTINVDVRGDATIEANGSGALVFANDFSYIADPACDPTLTLSGTSTAANEMSTIKQQLYTLTSLVKTGSGRWVLSKNNLHGGTNELRNGTLEIAIATLPSAGALGTLPAALQMTGADGPVTLLLAGGVTFTKWVAVTTEGGAATIGGADAGTSAFNDPTSFILAGRPLTLQAATGGTVEFRNNWNNATGDEYPSVDITIGSNGNTGTVLLTADLSTTGTVTVAHGTLHVTGASGQFQFADEVVVSGAAAELRYDSDINMERPLSLTAGTLSGDATINTVAVSNAPTIRVDTGDEIEIDDELSGSGTLAKTGAGTLRLAASTFSGTLNILAGEVVLEQIKTNPGGLVSTATFSNTALSVAFTGDPVTDDEFVLLSGPTTQTYTPTLTGTTKTGTYNASTSTLTID